MHRGQAHKRQPEIIDVEFISDDRAALRATCGDGTRWGLTSRDHGEQVARELARQLAVAPTQ
jgi:hypothetical protein